MGDSFAIYALRRKRARLAGEILAAQAALGKKREALATLDAVIRMFEPASNPELIAPIRPARGRCMFFRHGEQMRLAVCALREAGKPVSCRYVAEYAMAAKGLNPEGVVRERIIEGVRAALERLGRRGLARKIVEWPDTWRELAGVTPQQKPPLSGGFKGLSLGYERIKKPFYVRLPVEYRA